MVMQKSYGGRPIGRGKKYLAWIGLGGVCLILVQFWAYYLKWSSDRSQSFDDNRSAFKDILSESWFVPDNVNNLDKIQDSRLLRKLVEAMNHCETTGGKEKGGKNMSSEECRMNLLTSLLSVRQMSPPVPQREPLKSGVENVVDKMRLQVLESEVENLRKVLKNPTVFLELKDKNMSGLSDTDVNWFMSSIRWPQTNDGNAEELQFPSELSLGRLLCLMGNHPNDGTQNKYGFAWTEYLPPNATLLPGTTLVADNYWDYDNIWHGMTALASFVLWRGKNQCEVPQRVLLYHWGELVSSMSSWVDNMLHAAFGMKLEVETMEKYVGKEEEPPVVCLERAIVNRRGFARMSVENLSSMFDTIRCRARKYCGVVEPELVANSDADVHVTLLARTGARAFKNTKAVIGVLDKVCEELGNCHLEVSYASNITFCEQVGMMSRTDVLVTTHGAQMTNTMFMSKGSSVMEFYPKGWLEFGGVGQYIYQWLAEWSNLNHEGVWRDPEGRDCPYPTEETLKCFFEFKDIMVGHNATHLADWTRKVVNNFKVRQLTKEHVESSSLYKTCTCDMADGL